MIVSFVCISEYFYFERTSSDTKCPFCYISAISLKNFSSLVFQQQHNDTEDSVMNTAKVYLLRYLGRDSIGGCIDLTSILNSSRTLQLFWSDLCDVGWYPSMRDENSWYGRIQRVLPQFVQRNLPTMRQREYSALTQ